MRFVGDDECPSAVLKVVELARTRGCTVAVSHSDGPPASLVVRVRREVSGRSWGLWDVSNGTRWRGGATSALTHLPTLRSFKAWIEA